MYMHPVVSSNLQSVGYESGNLYIRFLKGGLYEYFNVPQHIYAGLMQASSHGEYFAQNIKNTYRYARIGQS